MKPRIIIMILVGLVAFDSTYGKKSDPRSSGSGPPSPQPRSRPIGKGSESTPSQNLLDDGEDCQKNEECWSNVCDDDDKVCKAPAPPPLPNSSPMRG